MVPTLSKEDLPTLTLLTKSNFAFTMCNGFVTLPLAHASDSLVRVSRRVTRGRYARILSYTRTHTPKKYQSYQAPVAGPQLL